MKRAANKPLVPAPSLLGGLALVACAATVAGCVEPPPSTSQRSPYRDEWRVEVDADFVHTAADGSVEIFNLIIGGREDNNNFANRGDVIVDFSGPENKILVEMRRFTFSTTEQAAEADYEDLQLWAYAAAVAPPRGLDVEDNCDPDEGGAWQNACEIRVYFDGLSQLERSGADLRVTLPPSYRRKINVTTQDNIEEEDYLNRGNVCVSNLFGSADIELESGKVWVDLNRDVNPAPECALEDVDSCENWTIEDDEGNQVAAPWAPTCPCIAKSIPFGQVTVSSRAETAADITVDMPAGVWASVKAENQGSGQEASGTHCTANVELANFEPAETGNDFPWQAFGNLDYPGMPAIAGAGFNIQAVSSSCEPVAYTESPDDFVGTDKGDEQESELRGTVRVCTDCITQSCNDLIP